MPVLGMGGYFFRAQDPAALKAWYRDHLGVGGGMGTDPDRSGQRMGVVTAGGPMVFEPFKADSDYFAADKQAMINLRVSDLDGLVASLREAGIDDHAGRDDGRRRPVRPGPRSRRQRDRAVGPPPRRQKRQQRESLERGDDVKRGAGDEIAARTGSWVSRTARRARSAWSAAARRPGLRDYAGQFAARLADQRARDEGALIELPPTAVRAGRACARRWRP